MASSFDIESPVKTDQEISPAQVKLSLQEETGLSSIVPPSTKAEHEGKQKPRCNGTLDEVTEEFLHDNEYIKTGYRVYYKNIWDVGMTAFKCHNETFNVWSHFLGVLAFLGLVGFVLGVFPNMEKQAFVESIGWANNTLTEEIQLKDLEL
mmetsp:Transcript_42024/g.64380  ORF Transcript_42024/g.64380 Transcript_42024/m.64380 type:complete len:150 (-) Transcript_42024:1057-1506(-)|eukprot:CAMPEP_0170499928 /NCGR_PEP_ID=MMETSP0208-20121228/33112_1 /TAXON_ID=197538 /ORGANISM="Strombidium inclinatum, Strain S3" /LENGTH=149 /DNA_ID=CAMNT_0010777721 /DNA_START=153 /DNA_END=602 /DNA_ORIENTATION=-